MKKYIVTDPCYIIPDEIWDNACKEEFDNKPDMYERFNKRIQEELSKFSGSNSAWVSDTGFGDWSNHIYGTGVVNSEFCADAGMVCVCELTPIIEDFIKKDGMSLDGHCIAVFETDSEISVTFNTGDPNWTVVEVNYLDGSGSVNSEYPYIEEEEEDDFWSDDEDEEEEE